MEGGDATKRDITSADEETSRRSRGKEVLEAGAAAERASTSADEETSCQSGGKEVGPSLNSLALMRQATTPNDIWSVDIKDWRDVVYEGVLLEKNTQKFWVDKRLHKNCFLVLPKACDIAGSDDESCWTWITEKENWFSFPRAVDIPVPKAKELSWFSIQGRFNTRALSPNTAYEVAFVIKLSENPVRWGHGVELELDLPDGTKQTRTEVDLERKPKEEWIKLRVGAFKMCPETVGRIYFALQWRAPCEMSDLILRDRRALYEMSGLNLRDRRALYEMSDRRAPYEMSGLILRDRRARHFLRDRRALYEMSGLILRGVRIHPKD